MCLCRRLCHRFSLLRLFFLWLGGLGPDDPHDEAARERWHTKRRAFRGRIRSAFRDLLDDEDAAEGPASSVSGPSRA